MSQDEEDHGAEPYTLEHLSAVVRPVILTMSLAAFAVANIRDPDPAASSESIYLVYSSKPTPGGGVVAAAAAVLAILGRLRARRQ